MVWANEFEPSVHATYEKNYPNTILCKEDIISVDPKDVPDCDGFIGGPPCQSWSVAGKQQGLEIDWACVTWDADLRLKEDWSAWQHFQLRSGTKWQRINKEINKEYQINAYRVLLTRGRQGMVIVVPNGDDSVPPNETRKPEWYDGIYDYLKSVGIREL